MTKLGFKRENEEKTNCTTSAKTFKFPRKLMVHWLTPPQLVTPLFAFSACGGMRTGKRMPVLTAYFPVLAYGILGKVDCS